MWASFKLFMRTPDPEGMTGWDALQVFGFMVGPFVVITLILVWVDGSCGGSP